MHSAHKPLLPLEPVLTFENPEQIQCSACDGEHNPHASWKGLVYSVGRGKSALPAAHVMSVRPVEGGQTGVRAQAAGGGQEGAETNISHWG